MDDPVSSPTHRPHRTVVVVLGVLVGVVLLIGVGVYGLLRGPSTESTGTPPAPVSSAPTVTGPGISVASPSPIALTGDPEEFARRVAVAVFTWDTADGYRPADYMQALLNVGDPSGQETPGLAADLANYLPNTAAWDQLRSYDTSQWLTITSTAVPSSWAQALHQGQGTLLPGTRAYTITGTRHRAGVWDGKPVTTTGQVSFTIFETCQPSYTTCQLLRLSQLGNPLH